jgi:hypothetical protein
MRGLRPMVLVAAMIAPAILASGLLAVQFSGYEEMARGSAVESGHHAQPQGRRAHEGTSPARGLRPEDYPLIEPPMAMPPSRDLHVPRSVAPLLGSAGPTAGAAEAPQAADTPRKDGSGEKTSANAGSTSTTTGSTSTTTGEAESAGDAEQANPDAAPDGSSGYGPASAGSPVAPAAGTAALQGGASLGIGQSTSLGGTAGNNEQLGDVQRQVLDPTAVPEPLGPARLYEGLIRFQQPAPAAPAAPVAPVAPAAPVALQRRPSVEPKVKQPEPQDSPLTCAPEWRDTWLGELCS